jgi:hypothetical protein
MDSIRSNHDRGEPLHLLYGILRIDKRDHSSFVYADLDRRKSGGEIR